MMHHLESVELSSKRRQEDERMKYRCWLETTEQGKERQEEDAASKKMMLKCGTK